VKKGIDRFCVAQVVTFCCHCAVNQRHYASI
jgi:hypothetical protein